MLPLRAIFGGQTNSAVHSNPPVNAEANLVAAPVSGARDRSLITEVISQFLVVAFEGRGVEFEWGEAGNGEGGKR